MSYEDSVPNVPTQVDFSVEDAAVAFIGSRPTGGGIDVRRIELGGRRIEEKSLLEVSSVIDSPLAPGESAGSLSEEDAPPPKQKRQKRKTSLLKIDQEQLLHKVKALLVRMEDAAADDINSNSIRRPAIEKLKMLEEVEEACIHREMQPLLLNEGLLGVLKSWIEPLGDGTLPNLKIRTTVLRILHRLPIDTASQSDRENLKTSQIGSRVMFLSRIRDETAKNRRLASELVQRWSRPIFEEAKRYDEDERIHNALSARKRRMETERVEDEKRKKLKPGDPDFRYVAMRPQPNRDYVIKPKSSIEPTGTVGQKKDVMLKKINRFKRDRRRS